MLEVVGDMVITTVVLRGYGGESFKEQEER